MNTRIFFLPVLLLFAACSQNTSGDEEAVNASIDSSSFKPKVDDTFLSEKKDTNTITQTGDTIRLLLVKGVKEYNIKTHIDSVYHAITCVLTVGHQKKLTASVNPVKGTANLRFNQLYLPNGESDGPFGKDLEYSLKSPGVYKLVIGSSKMAEDPYTGEFDLYVRIE